MTQETIAVLMWVLVLSLLTLRRGRTDHSITYAAILIAVAMTLNIDSVYIWIDRLLGGTNLATLISDGLLMVGLFFLGRGVMHAGRYRPGLVRFAVGVPALFVALAAIITLFFFINRGGTTATFMLDLGAQPVAAFYSIISFTYCGIVLTAMLVLAIRQCASDIGIPRLPAALLAVGSACGIALCIVVLIMDIAHVAGALDLMGTAALAYNPLTVLTFAFLCIGFAGQPALRFVKNRLRRVKTDVLIAQLEPIWFQALRKHPGLSGALPETSRFDDPEARLHRQIVEIRDAMLDPKARLDVSASEIALLERAELHLLGDAASAKSDETTGKEMRTEEGAS